LTSLTYVIYKFLNRERSVCRSALLSSTSVISQCVIWSTFLKNRCHVTKCQMTSRSVKSERVFTVDISLNANLCATPLKD